jgi:hypothetical protein
LAASACAFGKLLEGKKLMTSKHAVRKQQFDSCELKSLEGYYNPKLLSCYKHNSWLSQPSAIAVPILQH